MKTFLVSAAAIALLPIISLQAADPEPAAPSPIVARVNSAEITRTELDAALKGIQMQMAQQGRSIPPAQLAEFERGVLDDLISRELVLQDAQRGNLEGLEAEVNEQLSQMHAQAGGAEAFQSALAQAGLTPDGYRQRLQENLLVQRALRSAVEKDLQVSDEEIAAFYKEHQGQMREPELAQARHILLRVAPTASDEEKAAKRAAIDALREQLVNGADFAALAKEHSEDPGSAERGGDLGSFPAGTMVPAFDAAAFSLDPGQISDVITTQFGYHVLEVTSRTPARELPLSEVRDQIDNHLQQQKGSALAEKYVAGLRESAKIEVLLPPAPAN